MKRGYVYILFATLFFSSMEISLKLVAAEFNPIQLNFLRFVIGAVILWPLARRVMTERGQKFQRSHIPFFIWSGFLCVVVSMTFFQLAILYAPASTVAILFSCNAVFVIPLAHLFLNEKMSWLSLTSLVVSVIGMLCIVDIQHLHNIPGVSLSLLSALSFAIYGIVGQLGHRKYGYTGLPLTFYSFVAGCIEMALLMAITHISGVASWLSGEGLTNFVAVPFVQGITWHSLILLLYLGIFVTGLGYSFYFLAMEQTSAATASIVFFVKPALAPILAMIILSEAITENTILGILFILVGSSLPFIAGGLHAHQLHHHLQHQSK